MIPKYITAEEYANANDVLKAYYKMQYQEWHEPQPGSGTWNDISESKAVYTNNPTRIVYKLIN